MLKVHVTVDSGLTYTASGRSLNAVWIDVCRFILESGCKVHQLVPYEMEDSDV